MLGLGQSGYATGCECEYGAVEQSQSLKHLKIHGLDNKKISQPQLGICWEVIMIRLRSVKRGPCLHFILEYFKT